MVVCHGSRPLVGSPGCAVFPYLFGPLADAAGLLVHARSSEQRCYNPGPCPLTRKEGPPMLAVETSELVPVLQTAVSPVVLISGVGLLLLTMTNRLGRIVDRARSLAARVKEADGEDPEPLHAQLRILSQRAIWCGAPSPWPGSACCLPPCW